MIVIVILGVLATLGVVNYRGAVEKARGAEARQTLGLLRTMCAATFLATQDTFYCTPESCGMCPCCAIPDNCCPKYYFIYEIESSGGNSIVFKATRCTAGTGRIPSGQFPHILTLTTDY